MTETLSQQFSRMTSVPLLADMEEKAKGQCWFTEGEDGQLVKHTEGFANPPTEYARPLELKDALKDEAVTGLYWHQGQLALVLQMITGRRIGIPVISFRHPLAEIIDGRLAVRTYVEFVADLIKQRRPS